MRALPLILAPLALSVSLANPARASVAVDDDGELEAYADFRLRFEADWDSQRSNASPRDDRDRARIRARVGLNWKPLDDLSFGIRLRSGSDLSHQSPHITILDFDDNDTGDASANLDKWFVKGTKDTIWGWAGRNSLPFWKQNEMFWDDDATPAGLAGGGSWAAGDSVKVTLNLGLLTPPVGMEEFSGDLTVAQLVYAHDGSKVDFTLAGGLLDFAANPGDPDAPALRKGNGLRDYSITVLSAQVKGVGGGKPLVFGLDYMDNGESYTAADAFAFANRDETDGYVASIKWGGTGSRGDWLLGYWYAEIGALAVNASYAQDDWIRWGSATETDASDLEGSELRFAYGLGGAGNLVFRLYLVEAITSVQDGNRFRVDWNVKF